MGLLLCVLEMPGTPRGHPCHSRLRAMRTQPLSACRSDCIFLTLELTASLPCSLAPLLPECPVSGLHGWPCLTLSWPEGWGGGMGGVCTVQLLFRGSGWDQCLLLCFSPWLESWQARGGAASLPAKSSQHPSRWPVPEPPWKLTKKAFSWALLPGYY